MLPVCDEIQFVLVVRCPHCATLNYLIDDSPLDETKCDMDGLTCCQCKQESFFASSVLRARLESRWEGCSVSEISLMPEVGCPAIEIRKDGTLSSKG